MARFAAHAFVHCLLWFAEASVRVSGSGDQYVQRQAGSNSHDHEHDVGQQRPDNAVTRRLQTAQVVVSEIFHSFTPKFHDHRRSDGGQRRSFRFD
jgi:hypothetical protein